VEDTDQNSAATPLHQTRDSLILENLPRVRRLAHRVCGRLSRRINFEDMVSAGVVALIEAAYRFDPSRNVKFSTFAELRVRGALLDHRRETDWSRRARRRFTQANAVTVRLAQELGRTPEETEIADGMNIGLDTYRRTLIQYQVTHPLSLELVNADCEARSREVQAGGESPDQYAMRMEERDMIAASAQQLTDEERSVIGAVFFQDRTLGEVAQNIGCSLSKVSDIKSRALKRLRELLSGVPRMACQEPGRPGSRAAREQAPIRPGRPRAVDEMQM
jgi:RNA polymerase sigma factor for flagellar operon FliA